MILLYVPSGSALSQINPWSASEYIEVIPPNALHVKIAFDANDILHIVWAQDTTSDFYPEDIYYSNFDGDDWSVPVNISNSPGTISVFPALVVDAFERIHIVWGENIDSLRYNPLDPSHLFYVSDSSGAWTTPELLYNSESDAFTPPQLLMDSQSNLHLLWSEPNVMYRRKTSEGWTEIEFLGGQISTWIMPNAAIDGEDGLHISYVGILFDPLPLTNVLFYIFRSSPGEPWSDSLFVFHDSVGARYWPQLTVNGDGMPRILWLEDLDSDGFPDEILFSELTGGVWSEAESIIDSGGTPLYSSVVTDPQGVTHVVWSHSRSKASLGDDHVYYKSYDGFDWSDTINISGYPSKNVELPFIEVDSDGMLHAVWSTYADGRIYYAFTDTTTGIAGEYRHNIPEKLRLYPNTPNPFNSHTKFNLEVPMKGQVSVNIYSIRGDLVASLSNRVLSPGLYDFIWEGKNNQGMEVGSGIYFYTVSSRGQNITRKMVLIR